MLHKVIEFQMIKDLAEGLERWLISVLFLKSMPGSSQGSEALFGSP